MVALTALWGFQQVTIKWIVGEVPFVMQAAMRSILATVLRTPTRPACRCSSI